MLISMKNIKEYSSDILIMLFFLLIYGKMPTVVGILALMSNECFILS